MKVKRESILRVSFGLLFCFVFGIVVVYGQIAGQGSIQGTITDPSGANVPGATVTATNVATGVVTTAETTGAGLYVLSPLPPGEYAVAINAKGFQQLTQQHVTVNGLTIVSLNLTVQLGSTSQQVTVAATPPPLNMSDGTLGTTVESQAYTSLPLAMSGGPEAPSAFIYLLPGVSKGNADLWAGAANINGGEAFSNGTYVNGLPLIEIRTQGDTRPLNNSFSVDAIDQFQVDVNGTPPMYQGQGIQNYQVKEGTNHFHGDLYEFLRNNSVDSRGFFSSKVPIEKQNEFGVSLGGPIRKDRVFFFANYDGYRHRTAPAPSFYSLPTAAEQEGNFSALPYSIYDPSTTTCSPTGACTNQAYLGNIISPGQISKISQALQAELPATINSNLQNNYLGALPAGNDQNDFTTSIDANIAAHNRVYGLLNWGRSFNIGLAYMGGNQFPLPYTDSRTSYLMTGLTQVGDTYTISPTLINQFNFSANRWNTGSNNATLGGNWAQKVGLTGLPPGIASDMFPPITFSGPDAPTEWADATYTQPYREVANTFVLGDNVGWIHGKHSFNFGTQIIRAQLNEYFPGFNFGYNFSNTETAGFSPSGTLQTNTGNAYASFLLGEVNEVGLSVTPVPETALRNTEFGFYVADNWKATHRLTVNLGLRYDLNPPYTEAYNRNSFFNPTLSNPAVDGYPGALEFFGYGPDSCGCRTPVQTYYKDFGPRIGFAYELTPHTVLRGAYGIFYFNSGALDGDSQGAVGISTLGFNSTPSFSSLNGGITAAFNWASPFPSFPAPPFFNPSLNTGFNTTSPSGGGIAYGDPLLGDHSPYMQNWNITVERLIGTSTTVNVSYSASVGHYLATGIGRGIYSDEIQPQYLALGNLLLSPATPSSIAAADAIIPGIGLPYANFEGTIGQMLRPFPQYSGVSDQYDNIGNSTYNSLQVQAQRHFSHGLSFLVSYTLSKEIDDAGSNLGGFFGTSDRTAYNNRIEKAVGYQDIPNTVVGSYVYQLPFGAGHQLGNSNKPVRALVSGWRFSGIQSYTQGIPLGVISGACNAPYTGACYANFTPNFSGSARINGSYGSGNLLGSQPPSFINANAFESPAPFTFGSTPRTLAFNLRNPPLFDEDFSLARQFVIHENMNIQVRADAFNAFNRVAFGSIPTNITSSNFGTVGSQANIPREFQFEAKFVF